MRLYRELPLSAQTAYAELQELAQVAEAARSPAFLSGKVAYKTIKGRRYAPESSPVRCSRCALRSAAASGSPLTES